MKIGYVIIGFFAFRFGISLFTPPSCFAILYEENNDTTGEKLYGYSSFQRCHRH